MLAVPLIKEWPQHTEEEVLHAKKEEGRCHTFQDKNWNSFAVDSQCSKAYEQMLKKDPQGIVKRT